MSLEQLKAFLHKVKGDSKLQDKLKASKSPDEVVAIAKEHGHEFTPEHINEISDSELEGVSGGTFATLLEVREDGIGDLLGDI